VYRNRKLFIVVIFLFICGVFLLGYRASEDAASVNEEPSTSSSGIPSSLDIHLREFVATDSQRLVALHGTIWNLLNLSPSAKLELNGLVNHTNSNLQWNKYKNPQQYNAVGQQHLEDASQQQVLSKEEFESRHRRRLQQILKVSDDTFSELEIIMNKVLWRTLYDPNAYKDPSFDLETSRRLKILFENGPPKCCNERMYERAKVQ